MEYVKTCHIKGAGDFEYYLTETKNKTSDKTITTYGVAIKDVHTHQLDAVYDIWDDKQSIMDFINILIKNQVTCVHLKQLCEEFAEELYSI
ncbi:MAG: hypothetical protein IJE46_00465 [Clostridia bacterium]|nr:hypothetical protein [Clostridia bacterium]